jgi:HSP20 family protein
MENKDRQALVKRDSEAVMKRPEPLRRFVRPAADIFETGNAFVLKIDLPGIRKESIRLSVEPNRLTVAAETAPNESGAPQFLFSEVGGKNFLRDFNLGFGIDRDNITARLQDGVLTVTLPKTDDVKAREIHIQ